MATAGHALRAAVRQLADDAGAAAAGPSGDQLRRAQLGTRLVAVHDAAMKAAADGAEPGAWALADAAAVVRDLVPEGTEGPLEVRARIFVRLLRIGALEPAWTLAADNASGVVRPARAVTMWAGGSHYRSALPLPTVAQGGHVYAWLPGFRDPRWQVPDEVYDLTGEISLDVRLQQLSLRRGRLVLAGTAFLDCLTARQDDDVHVVLSGPDGAEHRTRALRVRTPDLVEPDGPELTRLAWAGWHAEVDLTRLADRPGRWSARLDLEQGGVARSVALGPSRGPYAASARSFRPQEAARRVFRLTDGPGGGLTVTVALLGPRARYVPRVLRAGLRSLFPRP